MRDGPILSLDIATLTGWAVGPVGAEIPISGCQRITHPGADLAVTFHKFDHWLADLITVHDPSLIVFEAPVPRQNVHGFQTARKLLGLAAVCELVAYQREVECREAAVQTVRKHFCGNGRADKQDVIARCVARGWNVTDDNEADALALWDYACAEIKRRAA